MAKRRRFSEEPFGADGRAPDERDGGDVPWARRQDRPVGRLPEPPRPRQPARAVERRRRPLAKALGVEPEHFLEYRLRVITERLEAMPDLVDRLYKRLACSP